MKQTEIAHHLRSVIRKSYFDNEFVRLWSLKKNWTKSRTKGSEISEEEIYAPLLGNFSKLEKPADSQKSVEVGFKLLVPPLVHKINTHNIFRSARDVYPGALIAFILSNLIKREKLGHEQSPKSFTVFINQ